MIKIMPHISEKSVSMAKTGWFTLNVPLNVSGEQVKTLLKTSFKVTPLDIRMITKKTILRKRGAKLISERGYKKAIVKLSEKQIFPGFESYIVEPKEKKEKKDQKETKTKNVKKKDA
ncbi:MAG: 50S ribosomal protein L23 [candidate division WS2 bacterium ADurb.Bin280]|uniref:50S ribosomal protein L23 n=1 Tax=candidate division WS2 bacterium ADurb.Bin280 TaxID=1852829 RepID=A0A1V5SE74_9BACT|nr:MAG: 50S ribosomal protein L23 [candidate division WS2 bacterium ADurb.Bin280]